MSSFGPKQTYGPFGFSGTTAQTVPFARGLLLGGFTGVLARLYSYNPGTKTASASGSGAGSTITLTDTNGLQPGMKVTASGGSAANVPAGDFITAVDHTTKIITLNAATTGGGIAANNVLSFNSGGALAAFTALAAAGVADDSAIVQVVTVAAAAEAATSLLVNDVSRLATGMIVIGDPNLTAGGTISAINTTTKAITVTATAGAIAAGTRLICYSLTNRAEQQSASLLANMVLMPTAAAVIPSELPARTLIYFGITPSTAAQAPMILVPALTLTLTPDKTGGPYMIDAWPILSANSYVSPAASSPAGGSFDLLPG